MVLKRISTLLNRRPSQDEVAETKDNPEGNAVKGVRLFCESAANSGDEVLHLPTIVENAVASPQAATAAATQIRKFLSTKNSNKPHIQYNAIMLIRILADNPGASFTKNIDDKFVDTAKQVLRQGRDPSVQQILRETLEALNRDKAYDTNLNGLFAMWRKEQSAAPRTIVQQPVWSAATGNSSANYGSRRSKTLPPPTELAARVEEARTSAKLLLQLVQSTPPNELFNNELVKEFSERCQSAQRSVQGYINADSPAPDDDTMLTLIETNEQLSLAASKHQRAVLAARRALGLSPSPPGQQPGVAPIPNSDFDPPAGPPPQRSDAPQIPPLQATASPPLQQPTPTPIAAHSGNLPASLQAGATGPTQPTTAAPRNAPSDNPFSDEHTYSALAPPVQDYTEPYHPGYNSGERDRGYGPDAGTVGTVGVSTMGTETMRSQGDGRDISPVEDRRSAQQQQYRY